MILNRQVCYGTFSGHPGKKGCWLACGELLIEVVGEIFAVRLDETQSVSYCNGDDHEVYRA